MRVAWSMVAAMSVPFAVEDLDHVVLRCRDREEALDFYTRVLGLPEERRLDAIGLIQLRAGRSLVDLVPRAEGEAPGPGNVEHFCLGVAGADMATIVAYLERAGVEMLGDPMVRYGARGYRESIYLRDPEGNVVELTTGPSRSQ